MNVLSLFDGMSCGQIALERAGKKVDKYFASEIKAHGIKVSSHNYPNTIHVGDVTKINVENLPIIDLLIGGSPCQSFSNANQWVSDGTDGFDGKSKLFFEYIRLLNELKAKNPNLKFILENVRMKKEWKDLITKYIGVQPIEINSSVFTAQNRPRLYWTNIDIALMPPADKGVLLKDIVLTNVDQKYFLSEKAIAYMSRDRNGKPRWEYHKNELNGKAACLTANMFKGVPYGVIKELSRRLTPVECERLQSVPDNYTACVSDTSRYNLLGDGWTVDVIAHIFKGLKMSKLYYFALWECGTIFIDSYENLDKQDPVVHLAFPLGECNECTLDELVNLIVTKHNNSQELIDLITDDLVKQLKLKI